jgi:hypothetical protein
MDKRYQVFISSTFADLKEERAKVQQAIMELDCIPAGMEIFPAIDEEQFEFIKRIIDDCDYYLLIIGGRYGSLTDEGVSYTEMEYEYAISKGIKVVAFIHANPEAIPYGKSEQDLALRGKLEIFRKKVSTNRLIKHWNTAEDLPGLVALSLSKTIKTYPAVGWIRADTLADPDVYKEMNGLRKENQELRDSLAKLSTPQIPIENLAGLDEKIIISGVVSRWSAQQRRSYEEGWSKELSWERLFSLIAPYLANNPDDDSAKKYIGRATYEQADTYSSNGSSPTVNDQIFQTIKIQLKTLGLVKVDRLKTISGSSALFWSLTKAGEQKMVELRAVRKPDKE